MSELLHSMSWLTHPLSLFHYLPDSLPASPCLFLSLSLYPCVYSCVSPCIFSRISLCLFLLPSLSLSVSLPMYLFLSLSLYIRVFFPVSLTVFLPVSPCLTQILLSGGYPDMTLSFCRDGDVKLSSHLDSHPLVSEQCEDLSHFTKRMYKQCTTVFGQSEPVKHLVEELQKFARSLIAWFSENSKAFSDPNRAARHYFLQAPPLHFLGCHSLCPSFSVCRAASYAVSREVRFFADQPDEAKKSQVVNSLRSILITCWPEDAKVVTAQRSSLVEALHNEAARAHNKSTYFAKTWGARDDQAMGW